VEPLRFAGGGTSTYAAHTAPSRARSSLRSASSQVRRRVSRAVRAAWSAR